MQELALLQLLADGRFHSGQKLATDLSLSRSGVWKAVRRLSEFGLEVHAVRGKGYRAAYPIDLLSAEQILSRLSPAVHEKLQKLEILTRIESTNRYLQEQSLVSAHPSAVLAECQTHGRGRRGRNWVSPFAANIYLSLSWRFQGGFGALEGLSLAVAVAILRSLESLGVEGAGIKWPNDIYWRNAKLSGILIDVAGEASGPVVAIIGVGVNVAMPSGNAREIDQQWIDLKSVLGAETPTRSEISALLISEIVRVLEQFSSQGFSSLLQEWRSHDISSGREVTLMGANGAEHGVSRGVDETGAFLLETSTGVKRFLSGDVSLRLAN